MMMPKPMRSMKTVRKMMMRGDIGLLRGPATGMPPQPATGSRSARWCFSSSSR